MNYVYFLKIIKTDAQALYKNYYLKIAVVIKQSSTVMYLFSVLNITSLGTPFSIFSNQIEQLRLVNI